VATGELPPPLRVALHRRVADSLEQLSGQDPRARALALATHFRQGEVWDKATLYFREAGRHAATHSAHHEAVACYEEALGALRHLPPSRETLDRNLGLRMDLRQSLYPLGRFGDLRDHLREAERLTETLGDRFRLGQVAAYVSNYCWITGDLPRALESGQRALALAGALDDHGLAVEANFRLGQAHWSLGQYPQAVAFFERCGTAGKPQTAAEGSGPTAWPAELGLAELSLYWLAPPLTELGRFEEALAAARRALDFATWAERPFALVGALAGIGLAHLYQGGFDEAAAALTRGLEVCRRWELAVHRPWSAAVLGYTYALAGRATEGLSLLGEAVKEADERGLVASQAWRLAWLGEASLLAGRPEDAATWAERALEQARQCGERGHEAWALRALAEVASARRRPDRAAARRHYEGALALAEALQMRPLVAHCHRGLGRLHGRARDRAKAREHLNTAMDLYREMDMALYLRQASTEIEKVASG
jgi:tetratricopeptide (TPR) repeat protein